MRSSDLSSDVCSSDLLLPINTRGMWVGTFNGLCNRLLRAHHRDAGLPQTLQILDSADQLSLIKRLIKGAGIEDRKSVLQGKMVSVRVDLGGGRFLKKTNSSHLHNANYPQHTLL